MNGPTAPRTTSEALFAEFVALLRETCEGVDVDLTGEPPSVVARTSGRIFTAAWPGDEGLFVRLRLEEPPHGTSELSHVPPGSLAYEAIVQTRSALDELITLIVDAHRLAASKSVETSHP